MTDPTPVQIAASGGAIDPTLTASDIKAAMATIGEEIAAADSAIRTAAAQKADAERRRRNLHTILTRDFPAEAYSG